MLQIYVDEYPWGEASVVLRNYTPPINQGAVKHGPFACFALAEAMAREINEKAS